MEKDLVVTHICGVCHAREAQHIVDLHTGDPLESDYKEFEAYICDDCYWGIAHSYFMNDEKLEQLCAVMTCTCEEGALEALKTFCWFWSIGFGSYWPNDIEGKEILDHLVGRKIKITLEVV